MMIFGGGGHGWGWLSGRGASQDSKAQHSWQYSQNAFPRNNNNDDDDDDDNNNNDICWRRYKASLGQLLSVNKTPGLSADQKTQLMAEARHGMTRAEAIKAELATLPPALPASTLDPLFSLQLPDPSAVRLVSEALQQVRECVSVLPVNSNALTLRAPRA